MVGGTPGGVSGLRCCPAPSRIAYLVQVTVDERADRGPTIQPGLGRPEPIPRLVIVDPSLQDPEYLDRDVEGRQGAVIVAVEKLVHGPISGDRTELLLVRERVVPVHLSQP